MPKNKKRKKSKKKAHPRKKYFPETDTETFIAEGIEIKREGKNVFIKNTRTAEQQAAFNENIKNYRPEILNNIDKAIQKVISIFSEYDKLKLLGGLVYNQIANQNNPEDDGISELTLELGLSFATAIGGNPDKEPPGDVITALIELLESLRHNYNFYLMTEKVTGKYSEIENKLRFRTMIESLYIRGNGYKEHIYSIYIELFSSHDKFFADNYGFTSKEILNGLIQLEDSFFCRLSHTNGFPYPNAHSRFKEWAEHKTDEDIANAGKHFIDYFGDDNPDLIVENTKIISYQINAIETYPELFKIRYRNKIQKRVIQALSQTFGDNSDFLNPKYCGYPLNSTKVAIKPIILYENDYYMFSFSLPTRNLFELTEQLILQADSIYYNEKYLGNKYSITRDNYLEIKTADLFSKIIPKSSIYTNVKYIAPNKDGDLSETELDLLIESDLAVYIIEIKAGGLSAPAKRGALKSLFGDLSETIGYGAYQNLRAYNYIQNNEQPEFLLNKAAKVVIDKTKKIFRITVTLEHLASTIATMYDLKEFGVIEAGVDFAWTCSIFDLMIFSDIIENESDFVEYLEKRIPLYYRTEIDIQDEMDVLGHFLEHDLIFDVELIQDLTNFQLYKYSDIMDNYFEKGGEKPRRKSRK